MMHRARVDLPQPVSPTSPRVSPRRTSRLTPSTACTTSRLRRNSCPDRSGKYLTTFSTRSRTSASVVSEGGVAGVSAFIIPPSRLSLRWQCLAYDLAAQLVTGGWIVRQPACRQVCRVIADWPEQRDLRTAPVHDVGTGRVER